jgi:hypothetical protein
MKFKPKILTIVLILISVYFVYLSVMEYQASTISEKFADEQFEIHLNETPAFPMNYESMSPAQYKEWQNENTIKQLQNEVDDNWNMDTYISWGIRAKIHLQIALLSIILTIISWRFDNLNKKG